MTSSGSVDHGRPVLDEAIGAFRARVEGMAGHGEHLAALLGGGAGGDEGAGAPRRLHDQDGQRNAGDDAVAAREVLGARHEARRVLADEAAHLADPGLQLGVLGRIDVVEAAREHGDRAGRQRRLVRGPVDAAGEARGDDVTGSPDAAREVAGELLPGGGGIAGADDGDDGTGQQRRIALDVEERGRRIEGGERGGIAGLDGEEGCGADAGGGGKLTLGLLPGADADGLTPAAPRQLGQGGQRRARRRRSD